MTDLVRLSDSALEAMLSDLESDRVERKRSASDRSRIRRAICAFANDFAGHGLPGVVLVGVEDDGRCASIPIDDSLLTTLSGMRNDGNFQPLPRMSVERRVLSGCELVVITVAPSACPPVRYEGRTWVRVGPTVQAATPDDELRLSERRRAGDLTFDLRPASSAGLQDLDLDYFRTQYLRAAIAPEVLEENRRSPQQQLEALRLTHGGIPSLGALLLLGRDPQRWVPGAYVQFLRIDGTRITDPIRDQKQLTGRLEDVLRRLDDLLELGISMRTQVAGGPRERREPDYPLVALQQLARNAIMHRQYEGSNSPVRISWYSDRVEILSPGGLYGKVNPRNFGMGATDYRNPLVAEGMHHLGFAQRFGLGLVLAREALEQNQNPPAEFTFESGYVQAALRPRT